MSPQHDYVIDNSTGANVRSDINSVLQAIASNNSGSSAPSTTVASQFFADTNAGIMKLRNTSNNGYVNLFTLAGGIDVDAASNFNEDVTFTGASNNIVFDKSDNALEFNDNAKATFGTGADMTIKHDGSNSEIINATGSLLIDGQSTLTLRSAGNLIGQVNDSETAFQGIANGAFEAYFDNTKRFETTSSGAQVTGNLDIGSAQLSSTALIGNDSFKVKLGSGSDLQLYHDGTHSYIQDVGTGHLLIGSSLTHITNAAGNENCAKFTENGAVELYHDGSKKFETDTDGGKLTGFLHAHARVSESGFTTLDRHVIQTFNSNVETLVVESTASTPFGMRIKFSTSPDNNSSYFLLCRDQGVNRLLIWSDGDIDNHDNSYGATSDEKLKENIVDANSQWEDVKAIKVRNFNFKTDTSSDKRLGVVAQELETICPSLVKEKSDFDENNNDLGTKTKSVKYSILYMKAFKALQEAITKIEVLEAKVAALEAA